MDAFSLNKSDIKNLQDDRYAALRGHWAINVPRLSSRLEHLCVWISKVCHQPAAAWWAAGQKGVHHSLKHLIHSQLVDSNVNSFPSEVYKAWRLILEVWRNRERDADLDWHDLKKSINRDGWKNETIKEFASIRRPYLSFGNMPRKSGSKPPSMREEIQYRELVSVEVKYPTPYRDADIPDDFLLSVVQEFRKNLEHAIYLEQDRGGYGLHHLSPIEPDKSVNGDSYERTHGISSILLYYVKLFKRLVESDPQVAKQECLAWRQDEEAVFDLLRIWIAGDPRIFSGKGCGRIAHAAEYAVVLVSAGISGICYSCWKNDGTIFQRQRECASNVGILQGPPPCELEERKRYVDRRAWTILNLIHWLGRTGITIQF